MSTDQDDFEVGDLVRVGRGSKTWRIESFFGRDQQMAHLEPSPDHGQGGSSVLTTRLTLVERPGGDAA